MMEDLKDIRKKITDIDNQMAELFKARMEQVAKVAEYKKTKGLPIFDPEREEQVVRNGANRIEDPKLKSYYVNFLKEIMELSKDYQRNILEGLKVAYSGTEGAFAHIAASKIFPDAKKIAYSNFKKAYDAVESGECDCAVLPVENSYAGDVDQVNDLMFAGNLYVNGMYDLPIIHDLLGLPGATTKDIKTVVSHPQALSQCGGFIKENELAEIEYSNTALAAEYVKSKQDKSIAAVASAESAKMFGLDVIARSINDDRSNTTRFAVFSRADNRGATESKHPYFSLLFTARNEAGSLAQALTIIGKHGFNMRTLRSRPMKELMWQYYFYVEAEGDIYGEEGRACLEELKTCCDKIKVVGSYNTLHSQED
ncbi:MAG: chorismate mutase [Firmicutes bacterium]|nr:chorismate mutase [Bacillota bacterium]